MTAIRQAHELHGLAGARIASDELLFGCERALVHCLPPADGGDFDQQLSVRVHADLGRCKRQMHTDRRLAASTAHGDVASHGRTVRAPELERQRGESEQTPLGFLALGDTQKHLRRSSVVLPTHVELWVSRLVQPLVKEPTKIRSGFLLYYALEVFTRCGRVAVSTVVSSKPAKEG